MGAEDLDRAPTSTVLPEETNAQEDILGVSVSSSEVLLRATTGQEKEPTIAGGVSPFFFRYGFFRLASFLS
jgi:hypothetical protein